VIFLVILAVIALVVVTRRNGASAPLLVTILAVVVSGAAAGAVVSPVFFATTVLVAGVLVRAAHQTQAQPIAVAEGLADLPPALRETVARALHDTPSGEARRLLLALIAQAGALYAAPSTTFDEREEKATRSDVDELVEACCASAVELGRLDRVLSAATARSDQRPRATRAPGAAPTPSGEVNQRLASARELLVRRLSDATTALRALYAADVEHGTAASERVASLAAEIKSDAAARSAAIADMNRLLS
jgi:hypothetical protein